MGRSSDIKLKMIKLLRKILNIGRWKPEGNKWYSFYDSVKSTRNLDLNLKGDRIKIKPYAYINGKRHRAKFYVTKDNCKIIIRDREITVPIKKCSFRRKLSQYYQGQSEVSEYYITVLVKESSKSRKA